MTWSTVQTGSWHNALMCLQKFIANNFPFLPALTSVATVQADPHAVSKLGVLLPAYMALPTLRSSCSCSSGLLLHLPLRMPQQLPGISQAQRLLYFARRNEQQNLKGENLFAGIHVVSGNTRILELQTGTKNRDVKVPIPVFFYATTSGRKPTVTWTAKIRNVIAPGCSSTKTCLGR